ncbi:heme-binding protein [uncultured Chitinophaga sp.]|jgi:Domain of unknown function (DUF336).|nr:heme-binding protein [uncultured Chitinophaga sp.]
MDVTVEQAKQIANAAEAKAAEIGVPMNIAILDKGVI